MSSNQAAWIDGKGKELRVADAPMPKAGSGKLVVKNHAIAVNPVDWKIQDYGIFVQTWPFILGTDIAGEVAEVGEGVSGFKKGDRVAGHVVSLMSGKPEDGGFQLYSSVDAAKSTKLPSSISFAQGSVIPLAFDTAAVGLYKSTSDGFLGLPLPSHNPSASGKTIVVWGGSSSVGALAIQLAAASGVKVVAVASERNFDFCKKLGASAVFDYKNKDSIVDDVVNGVKQAGGSFAGVYDAISVQDQSFEWTVPIAEKLGGGTIATVLPPPDKEKLPANVRGAGVFGIDQSTHQLWADFIPKALESGQLKCVPEPLVVGKGLESVQKGLNKNKEGVSAKKVVIEL